MISGEIPLSRERAYGLEKIGTFSRYVVLGMFLVSISVFFITFLTELNIFSEFVHDRLMVSAFAMQLIFPAAFIFVAYENLKIRLNSKYVPYFLLLFLVYAIFLFSLLSFVWSDYPLYAIKKSITIFVPVILLSVVMLFDDNPIKTFNYVSIIFVATSLLSSIYGEIVLFAGKINPIPLSENIYEQSISLGILKVSQIVYGTLPFLRISSFLSNPNSLAVLNSVGIVFTLYLSRIKYIKNSTGAFLLFVQAVSLLLTFSRDGILFVALMLFAYFLWFAKRGTLQVAGLLFAGVLLVLFLLEIYLVYQSIHPTYSHTDGQSFLEKRLSLGLNGRDRIWRPVVEQITATPLFGIGFGAATEAILRPLGIEHTVHSSHLQILAELGIAGYALFLLVFFTFGWFALRAMQRPSDLVVRNVGAATFSLVFGFFLHDFLESVIVLWGPFTLLTAYAMFTLLHPRVIGEVVRKGEMRGIPVSEDSVYT
ncbi:O-antigen ligase family protein [Brockia lithotrophica]|uniref:O-antigen ligase n=1 Tax=Brockia lithotrophica TaxID=933949 RepID=A0A660KWB8_9BACL|nr:O-antigen ligase family protein [Brockia lithotrophica]RKQ84735.1 O-antigen ligase [Brockia lithotrophica]